MRIRAPLLCSWLLLCVLVAHDVAHAAGPVPPCDFAGNDLCGIDRPEDLATVDGSRWLVVSNASATESLLLLDLHGGRRVPATLEPDPRQRAGDPECAAPRGRLVAGGNDLRRVNGSLRLAVLNRAATAERIELLSVRERDGRTRWLGCVEVPARYAINDVALGPDGTLYASHMFERPASEADATALRRAFLERRPTGFALAWRADTGWRELRGTELSFANGIAVSRDGKWLAVSGTYSQALVLMPVEGGPARRLELPLQPDNLSPVGPASFLVTGHTGVPVTGVDACRAPNPIPCGFPFAVAVVEATGSAQVVYAHDGTAIPGASVALQRGQLLYLGSAFGDRITIRQRALSQPVTE
jgi:sugar lactone lactonase YvrE